MCNEDDLSNDSIMYMFLNSIMSHMFILYNTFNIKIIRGKLDRIPKSLVEYPMLNDISEYLSAVEEVNEE